MQLFGGKQLLKSGSKVRCFVSERRETYTKSWAPEAFAVPSCRITTLVSLPGLINTCPGSTCNCCVSGGGADAVVAGVRCSAGRCCVRGSGGGGAWGTQTHSKGNAVTSKTQREGRYREGQNKMTVDAAAGHSSSTPCATAQFSSAERIVPCRPVHSAPRETLSISSFMVWRGHNQVHAQCCAQAVHAKCSGSSVVRARGSEVVDAQRAWLGMDGHSWAI